MDNELEKLKKQFQSKGISKKDTTKEDEFVPIKDRQEEIERLKDNVKSGQKKADDNESNVQIIPDATIKDTIDFIGSALHMVSGLRELDEKIAAYFCGSTWFYDKVKMFPILGIKGPTGTGKSELTKALGRMAYKPLFVTATGLSVPVFRDKLCDANGKTILIDEADEESAKIEQYIGNRYSKADAIYLKNVEIADHTWKQFPMPYYGPTILNRRTPFVDQSTESRSILIETVPDSSRVYILADEIPEALISKINAYLASLRATVTIPEKPNIPREFLGRVSNSYKVVISLATAAKDTVFLEQLWEKLKIVIASFKDGQSYEPSAIVLQALIYVLTKEAADELRIRNVKIEGELLDVIKYKFGSTLNSRQVAGILRDTLKFDVHKIQGPNSVVPSVLTIHRACEIVGIKVDAVTKAYEVVQGVREAIVDHWKLEE